MSERTVRVSLTANIAGYLAGMEKAQKSTENLGKSSAEVRAKFEAQNKAMADIGKGMTAVGVVAAAGVALAVSKFADFDQAMSNVNASTHETTANMNLLRDAALDAGGRTVFSATEAANAVDELGKAGISTSDILGGALNGALDLAAAGGLGVADAAGIAAVALKTFKLNGTDMSHVADLLAAGAGKAMGDVTDLSAALSQSGQVAASTGISIEETTGTLAAFAAQGLLGSDAGTSFKSMLQRLTPQSAEAQTAMDKLGISAYDASGNFVGMSKFAGILQEGLTGLTTEQRNSEMATIFGSDAVRAATVLYSEGEKGISKWTAAVDDQGYAAETARLKLDNLKGDIEALGGAFDTALIQSGSAANDALRALVQTGTDAVDMFNSAPPIVQDASLAFGVATAAIGLTGGALLLGVPKIAAFKTSMSALNLTMGKTALVGGAVTVGITSVALMVGALATAQADAEAKAEAYADTLDATTNRISASTRDMVKDNLTMNAKVFGMTFGDSAYDAATKLGLGLDTVTDAASGNTKAMNTLLPLLNVDASSASFSKLLKETGLNGIELTRAINDVKNGVKGESASIEEAIRIAEQKQSVDKDTAASSGTVAKATLSAADAYLATADGASTLNDQLVTLMDAMNELNGVAQDASGANIDYQQSLDDVDEQIRLINAGTEGYTKTLDINEEAGRTNRGMLDDLAASNQKAAEAQFALDGDTAKYKTTLEQGHQAVVDRATALGANADEAIRIADEIAKIPSETEWTIIADTAETTRKLDALKTLMASVPTHLTTSVGVVAAANSPWASLPGHADGGTIRGPGTGTSDSVLMWGSDGEEVTRAAMATKYRGLLKAINADQVPNYASGYGSTPQYVPQSPNYNSAPSSSTPAPVYVQNPFTGAYLLAKVSNVADGQIANASNVAASQIRQGTQR